MTEQAKFLIVYHCDFERGFHVTFTRNATPYQIHKVARKLSGLPGLGRAVYENGSQLPTYLLLVKKGVTTPAFSRTVSLPDPAYPEELKSESAMANVIATMIRDFSSEELASAKPIVMNLSFVSEDEAIRMVRLSVSEA